MHDNLFVLPIKDPVLLLAFLLVVILLVPALFERLKLPGLVGLILAGIVVGPQGLEIVSRGDRVILLSTAGLLLVMFIAGLEIDMAKFNKYRQRSIVLGVLSFILPQVLGTLLGFVLGFDAMASVLLGSVLASHTLLAYPIVSKQGLGDRLAVTTAVGGTILTDILALLVLVIVAGAANGPLDPGFWLRLVTSLILYVAVVAWGVPRAGKWFFRSIGTKGEHEFVFVLATLFVVAFLAKAIGIEPIVGAFLAGLTLNRLVPRNGALMNRIQFVSNALFIPMFLLATGMLVDVHILIGEPETMIMAVSITVALLFTKWAASWFTGALYGFSSTERWMIVGLTIPQAAATLAATMVGYKLGIFTLVTVNAVIFMILVTCLLGPFITQRMCQRMHLETSRHPETDLEAPERILLPLSRPETADALLDLALILRRSDAQEPIFPMVAVKAGHEDLDGEIVQAERLLDHAMRYAAYDEEPVFPVTRIGTSEATAIAQAARENRASLSILGWHGQSADELREGRDLIDQVLAMTTTQTMVAYLPKPLRGLGRLIVIVPPGSAHLPALVGAARTLQRLNGQLGTRLELWPLDDSAPELVRLLARGEHGIDPLIEPISGWEDLLREVTARLRPDDLLVMLGMREGSLPWNPMIPEAARLLRANDPTRNFLVLYPTELEARTGSFPAPAETIPFPLRPALDTPS